MSWQKIPSLEEIYNEFHKQYWYSIKGIYPKRMKNFENVLNDQTKVEYLTRFQNMLRRNINMIDWKLYIKANAEILKNRFKLNVLGTLGANKIYKNYMVYHKLNQYDEDTIYNEIVQSLKFLNLFIKENNLTFETYLLENKELLPISLQHLYSGTISLYFYASFSEGMIYKLFSLYNDDAFFELFEMSKGDFITTVLLNKRIEMLKFQKVSELVHKLEAKFLVNNNK